MYLARIGRLDIFWSVNKLARAFTTWTKYCDKRLARLISCIHHRSDFLTIMSCGKQHNIVDWGCFKTLILQETLKTQNQHQEEFCAFLETTRCANKLDVQETNFIFTHYSRS